MPSFNNVTLLGYVGKDAEFRPFPSGGGVLAWQMATSQKYTDRNGQKKERTDWHRIELFGKVAEALRTYVTKGRLIHVTGRLQYDTWEDKAGVKRTMSKVVALQVQLIGRGQQQREQDTYSEDQYRGPAQSDAAEPPFEASDEDTSWLDS